MKRTTKQVIAEQQAINRRLWAKENGRLHHIDANKLIAEFMGYKLMPCNSGKAWDIGKSIPTKDHLFPIQGVLHTGKELKFHKSWDWLKPVIDKCYQEHMSKHIAEAVMTCNIDEAHKVVVEFIREG